MSQEMFVLLIEGSDTLTLHERARLCEKVGKTITRARYEVRTGVRTATSWACPKCVHTAVEKGDVSRHMMLEHKTAGETAAWMPVPVLATE
jgi:hypothetical protein